MSIFGDLCGPTAATSDPELVKCGIRCDEEIAEIRKFTADILLQMSQQTTAIIASTQSVVAAFQAEIRQWITQQIALQNQVLVSVRDSLSAQTAIAFNELVLQLQFMGLQISNPYDITTNATTGGTNVTVQNNSGTGYSLPSGGAASSGSLQTNGATTNEIGVTADQSSGSVAFGGTGQATASGTVNGGLAGGTGGNGQGLGTAGTVPGNGPVGVYPYLPNPNLQSGGQPVAAIPGGITTGPVAAISGSNVETGLLATGPVVNSAALSTAEAKTGQVSPQSLANAVAGAANAILQAAGNTIVSGSSTLFGSGASVTSMVSLPQFLATVGITSEQLCQLPAQQQQQVLNGYGQVIQGITEQQAARSNAVALTQGEAFRFQQRQQPWFREAITWSGDWLKAYMASVSFAELAEDGAMGNPQPPLWQD